MKKTEPKICIIGSGNVAFHFTQILTQTGFNVVGIYARNHIASLQIAQQNSIKIFEKISEIPTDLDLYLVCVSDDAVVNVVNELKEVEGIVAHTSGSVAIQNSAKRNAVFYPLQTFSKSRKVVWGEIPILIESDRKNDLELLQIWASKISEKVSVLNSEQRKSLHLAAVMCNNFTNHLLELSFEILEKKNISTFFLHPLLKETISKAMELGPKNAQTGPAKRNDIKVINEHLKLLENDEVRNLYQFFSQAIIKKYHKNE